MKKILLGLIISQCFFVSIFAGYQVDIDINNRKNKDAIKELQELNIFFQEKSGKDIEYYEKLLEKYTYEQEIIDNDLRSLQYIRSCKNKGENCEKKQGNFLEITDQSDEEVINSAIRDLDTKSSDAYFLVKKHTRIVESLYRQKTEIEKQQTENDDTRKKEEEKVKNTPIVATKQQTLKKENLLSQKEKIKKKIKENFERFLNKYPPLEQLNITVKISSYLEVNKHKYHGEKIDIFTEILKEKTDSMLDL